jgi:hypothetical protein
MGMAPPKVHPPPGAVTAGPVKMMLDDARGYERFAADHIDNYHYNLSRPL